MTTLREGLPPLPDKMRHLPIDERGYPVPFFVQWIDGKPDHRIVDSRKVSLCIKARRCWICGHELGAFKVFTVGPMCAVNRVSGEPPAHRDCALYAVHACPFLSRPRAKRRESNLPEEVRINDGMLEHNPGVSLMWTTRTYKPFRGGGSILYDMGPAERMEWFAEGRPATLPEIEEAIGRGFPALMDAARQDGPASVELLSKRLESLRAALSVQFMTQATITTNQESDSDGSRTRGS